MLDKNPNQSSEKEFEKIKNEFSKKNPNILLCKTPFLKSEFLNRIINEIEFPIIFLDVDLMYSGYVSSGLVKQSANITIIRPSKENFRNELKGIIRILSKQKSLIIIDSLNGLYNMFDDFDSARIINSSLVLLSSVAKYNGSQMILSGMAIKNEDGEWILSPSGRHILYSKGLGLYGLSQSETKIKLNLIENKLSGQSFEIIK